LSLTNPARLLERFGLRIGAGFLRAIASAWGESAGSLEMGMLKPCRNAFCAARSLPARVLGPVLDWRAAGDRSSRLSLRYHFACLNISELDILSSVDRLAKGGAEDRTMAVNFAKRDVPPRFGARQHTVESFEAIEFALQGLRHYVVDGQLCIAEHRLGLFSSPLIAGHPPPAEFWQVV
jgi:hypothetical protein